MKITVSLTRREADELLRCETRRMFSGSYAYPVTKSQQAATFKLRGAVTAALPSREQGASDV